MTACYTLSDGLSMFGLTLVDLSYASPVVRWRVPSVAVHCDDHVMVIDLARATADAMPQISSYSNLHPTPRFTVWFGKIKSK